METLMTKSYSTIFLCYLEIRTIYELNKNTTKILILRLGFINKNFKEFLSFAGSFTTNNKLNYYIKF